MTFSTRVAVFWKWLGGLNADRCAGLAVFRAHIFKQRDKLS